MTRARDSFRSTRRSRSSSRDDTRYETGYLPNSGSELIAKLRAHRVDFRIEPDQRSPWTSVAMFLLPVGFAHRILDIARAPHARGLRTGVVRSREGTPRLT
jgi:hypothetical protein